MIKKSFTALLLLVVGGFVLLYALSSSLLHQLSVTHLEKVELIANGHDFRNIDIQFSEVHLSGLRTATWSTIDIRGEKIHTNNVIPLRLTIDEVHARVVELHPLEVELEIEDFKVGGASLEQQKRFQFLLSGEHFKINEKIDLNSPGEALHHLAATLDALASGKHVSEPFEISAGILLEKDEILQPVRLVARRYQDGFGLAFSTEDLKKFTSRLSGNYTAGEIDLISRYPFRALKLIDIKRDAESSAQAQGAKHKNFPEDAYRHILWSFLLTRAYGHEYAQMVTDAHEEGLAGNDVFAREMDLMNNKLGRDYAQSQVGREDLVKKVLEDKRVIQRVENIQ